MGQAFTQMNRGHAVLEVPTEGMGRARYRQFQQGHMLVDAIPSNEPGCERGR